MKIEVGERYINARGQIILITGFDGGCCYYDSLANKYEYNGRVSFLIEQPVDLICEVVPEIMLAWQEDRDASRKSLIQAHIDWWTNKND